MTTARCNGRLYGNRCARGTGHPGMCYAPGIGHLHDSGRQGADEAHIDAALAEISIALDAIGSGLRRALAIVDEARP